MAVQPREGTAIAGYELETMLGEGGMGVVFLARAPDGREVALKVAKPGLGDDGRRRFTREAEAASRFDHPGLVGVLDFGEADGVPYIAQDYLSGGTLKDRIAAAGRLELAATVELSDQIAAGLDTLHNTNLIHRDVKPQNMLFDAAGKARLTDFGLLKNHQASMLTKPGQTVGSMDYMAPEQIRGDPPVSPATDVYSFACVIWECLGGAPPFSDRKGMQILWAHLKDEPPDISTVREDLPAEVGWTLARALEKEPSARPSTAAGFARLLSVSAGGGSLGGGLPR